MIVAKRNWRWALAAALLTSAVAVAGIVFWPSGGSSSEETSGDPVAAEAEGVGEGIQVHGDWVIEVRNADGSLAERREFENALTNVGSFYLTRTLARLMSPGEWGITILPGLGNSPCDPSPFCFISEVGGTHNWGIDPQASFATLQLSTQQGPNQFILQGNFDALSDGEINEVHTLACFSQPPNLDAAACNNTSTFTATTLQTPVNVVVGQQVLVTVRISFS